MIYFSVLEINSRKSEVKVLYFLVPTTPHFKTLLIFQRYPEAKRAREVPELKLIIYPVSSAAESIDPGTAASSVACTLSSDSETVSAS